MSPLTTFGRFLGCRNERWSWYDCRMWQRKCNKSPNEDSPSIQKIKWPLLKAHAKHIIMPYLFIFLRHTSRLLSFQGFNITWIKKIVVYFFPFLLSSNRFLYVDGLQNKRILSKQQMIYLLLLDSFSLFFFFCFVFLILSQSGKMSLEPSFNAEWTRFKMRVISVNRRTLQSFRQTMWCNSSKIWSMATNFYSLRK